MSDAASGKKKGGSVRKVGKCDLHNSIWCINRVFQSAIIEKPIRYPIRPDKFISKATNV